MNAFRVAGLRFLSLAFPVRAKAHDRLATAKVHITQDEEGSRRMSLAIHEGVTSYLA